MWLHTILHADTRRRFGSDVGEHAIVGLPTTNCARRSTAIETQSLRVLAWKHPTSSLPQPTPRCPLSIASNCSEIRYQAVRVALYVEGVWWRGTGWGSGPVSVVINVLKVVCGVALVGCGRLRRLFVSKGMVAVASRLGHRPVVVFIV